VAQALKPRGAGKRLSRCERRHANGRPTLAGNQGNSQAAGKDRVVHQALPPAEKHQTEARPRRSQLSGLTTPPHA
jgi:hypothetical protein